MVAYWVVGAALVYFLFIKGRVTVPEGENLEETIVPTGEPEDAGTPEDPTPRQEYLRVIAPIIQWLQNQRAVNQAWQQRAQVMTDTRRRDFNCWIAPFLHVNDISELVTRHAAHYYISVADLYTLRDDINYGIDRAIGQENRNHEQSREEFQSIRPEREAVGDVLSQFNNLDEELIQYYASFQVGDVPAIVQEASECGPGEW